ncbi:MAG: phosphoribosylformylglycinamidine cyclo-ligase [Chloroflexota bacterium]|nr:phosphoribosylformylglycinamidine cyclo-ligase [Chloroflexota bacterium]MDE2941538.1 phosphoribosylformylglycinamidine cyclo-ligase [Chloroflexota bacterium]MDE3267528.1 phosphoribosylformylglycinamidine cyclo-ligase [Chloroflexota bacterium]
MAGETYLAAGVNLGAARQATEAIKTLAESTHGPNVIGGVGFFGGMYRLQGYRQPVLVSSTDSPGTKLMLATLTGRFESVGVDVVNHCVNDVFVSGATPLFFLDYLGVGRLVPERAEALVRGVAEACRAVGCALIGGETAELPGIYPEDGFDLAGFAVGVVEEDAILDGSTIAEGDVLLAVPSNGLHTNGYSLARRVFGVDDNPSVLDRTVPELGATLGEALMEPHRCYYPLLEPVLPLISGMAHITGGGLPENVPRILPAGLGARFDTSAWRVPPIFTLIQEEGGVEPDEMYRVFNMGVGMVLACSPERADEVLRLVPEAVWAGEVVADEGVTLD